MDVGTKQYTGLSLDYRLKLWAHTTASHAVSPVAELLVFKLMQMFQQQFATVCKDLPKHT